MKKKVLIISTSLRGGSNSEILAKECEKGAKAAGHDVQFLSLKEKEIKYCIGCLSCQRSGSCVIKDDVADILEIVRKAEVIVFATPIYYYEMCRYYYRNTFYQPRCCHVNTIRQFYVVLLHFFFVV